MGKIIADGITIDKNKLKELAVYTYNCKMSSKAYANYRNNPELADFLFEDCVREAFSQIKYGGGVLC